MKITCVLYDDNCPFSVNVDETATVYDLQKAIMGESALSTFDAKHLMLYLIDATSTEDAIFKFQTLSSLKSLEAFQELSNVFRTTGPTKERIHILVKLPTGLVALPAGSAPKRKLNAAVRYPELLFHSTKQGTGHFTADTLRDNHILPQGADYPSFINEIRTKLQAKRTILLGHLCALQLSLGDVTIAQNFNVVDTTTHFCSVDEIGHYISIRDFPGRPFADDPVRFRTACDFFEPIASHLYVSYTEKPVFKREANWPLTFLAQITQGDNHLRRYTPRSDFLFSLDTCPRINIEIFSNPNESDRYRGLLQAGLLVRVVNMLNQKLDKPSFVAIMVYITEDFTAERYLVYQPELNDETIIYTMDAMFNLRRAQERFQFFFQLYNLPTAFPPRDGPSTIEEHLREREREVAAGYFKGFTATKRPKTESTAPSSSDSTSHFDNPPINQVFINPKYQVLPEIEVEGWTPLYPLPPTVCRARGPGNTIVMLKIVKPDEFKIHSFLASIDSPDSHTIPIFDKILRGVETLIVTQAEQVLRDAPPRLFKTTRYPLARQFLEGVSFMHKHRVAHLDLKPDNIVITATGRLLIIDYSVSVQVSGPESWIKGYRGTEGWVAPEIEESPDREYQPIRADLWSAGQVLEYFADRQGAHTSSPIRSLAVRLLSRNPQERPSLSTILDDPMFELKKKR